MMSRKIQFNVLKHHYRAFLLLAVLLAAGCVDDIPEQRFPDYSVRYDPDRDPFADGRQAIKLATASQRRILIEVGGNWCGWCRALQRMQKHHRDIQQQLHDSFVLLKVNVSDENKNEAFLSAFPKLQGYPQLYISDGDGKVLHAQDASEFVVDGRYSHQLYLDFLNRWKDT
jgi:thioredoxin-related protein